MQTSDESVNKCCGTCRRWNEVSDPKRPASLPLPDMGECNLDGKGRKANDMMGCMGWRIADPWDLDKREENGLKVRG